MLPPTTPLTAAIPALSTFSRLAAPDRTEPVPRTARTPATAAFCLTVPPAPQGALAEGTGTDV